MTRVLLSLLCLLVAAVAAPRDASAWSEKIAKDQDANTVCKFEPGAQCTGAVRIGVQLPGVDMREASMTTMRLDGANFMRANLSGAILQLSNLQGANLTLANLHRAHLHAVNLRGANLMLADLSKASLLDADLRGANLRGANIVGAILIQSKFGKAIWIDGRVCAEGSVGKCL